MVKRVLSFFIILILVLCLGLSAFASAKPSSGPSGDPPAASGEPAVEAMLIIDGCAIAHDLHAVPVDEIDDNADYIWSVSNGGGITYTDADGVVWGIYRAGQAGVFEIIVSSTDSPSPWTVEEQIWVGGSRIVELCVEDGKLTHVLTDELQSGPAFDVEIREMTEDPLAPPDFPADATIVSATGYSLYTKNPDSPQDAVIRATLYWDMTHDELFDIRFLQPMLPWDDNGAAMGWACVTDETLKTALEAGSGLLVCSEDIVYAKYLQIGGILWTGEPGSHPAAAAAVDYCAEIGGAKTTLNEYVRDPEGGKWYVESAAQPVLVLTADGKTIAEWEIPCKETNGHGVHFWMSDITFPGNMDAIKSFVAENGFGYDYYADGGITKNDQGFWQTPDAVTGATLDEAPTYLDLLKTLYNDILAGRYVVESSPAMASAEASSGIN